MSAAALVEATSAAGTPTTLQPPDPPVLPPPVALAACAPVCADRRKGSALNPTSSRQ
jgi:hypothetical protein